MRKSVVETQKIKQRLFNIIKIFFNKQIKKHRENIECNQYLMLRVDNIDQNDYFDGIDIIDNFDII